MKKAIQTKYIGPTNTRGSRIRVKANGVASKLYDFSHADSIDQRHAKAAQAFITAHDWPGVWIAGGMPDETGSIYCGLDGSFSREWCEKYLCGQEGADWFLVERVKP